MALKKSQQNRLKGRLGSIARVIACASFLVLTIIGVSSIVRAMSLETIANQNGIPASWQAASLGNPSTITVPITYWDQRQDNCGANNRQFEWTMCRIYAQNAQQGLVKNTLGSDGLPVPAYTTTASARAAGVHETSENVTGHDPVQPGDNFYMWFHDTDRSKSFKREITFTNAGKNTYTYGGSNIFPLDDVDYSNGDTAWQSGHNFHFTAHLSIPVKIAASGQERFEFSGDDDVWVFLDNQLVLDIGGLHSALEGWFTINSDGTITTYVETAGYKTINIGISEGDVVNLDFFYAERSTSASNTKITIRNMNWPISADSNLDSSIVGKISETESNLVQNVTSIKNRDPANPLVLERLAAYVKETEQIPDESGKVTTKTTEGYLPLSSKTLFYTTTPGIESSWQPVEISAPDSTTAGFNLATPFTMAPAGNTGDTLYFRYFTETSEYSGTMISQINYYTKLDNQAGVTYDYSQVNYTSDKKPDPVTHDVTIKYIYEDSSEAAPDHVESLKPGDIYEIESPEISGFTPNITKITGTMNDSDIEFIVIYKPAEPDVPEIPKHLVTIKYVYEDDTPAAESYIQELEEGTTYSVISPDIENYTPDHGQIEGIVGEQDAEHVVIYSKNADPEPIIPVDPETPDQPVEPEIPQPPIIPGSDIIGDDLVYVAPLGEVAFVPNTGVIGSSVAKIFEETFAEIILSQGFVMAMLLIFAGSFAIYFSYRKYMTPATAAATSKKTRKTTYAKSAKKMPASKKPSTKNASKMKAPTKKRKK